MTIRSAAGLSAALLEGRMAEVELARMAASVSPASRAKILCLNSSDSSPASWTKSTLSVRSSRFVENRTLSPNSCATASASSARTSVMRTCHPASTKRWANEKPIRPPPTSNAVFMFLAWAFWLAATRFVVWPPPHKRSTRIDLTRLGLVRSERRFSTSHPRHVLRPQPTRRNAPHAHSFYSPLCRSCYARDLSRRPRALRIRPVLSPPSPSRCSKYIPP